MSVTRVCGLLALFAGLAITLVHLRAEQTRCAVRLVRIEAEWMRLRRELSTVQARAARLRAPQRLRDRIESLQSDLVPPGSEQAGRWPLRLALNGP